MSAGKIIGYIFAAILIIFGVLYILASSNPSQEPGLIFTGVIMVLIGFGIIWFVGRKQTTGDEEVTVKIDLSGDVNLDTLTCKSCGSPLSPEHITMVAGAPVVACPSCGTTYQLTEEPKW